MDTKNFAELMSQAGLGNNTPVVNVADIARVSQSIERLIPMLEVKGKGDVDVVKALDKVAKTLASVSKNITIQNVAVPDAVTVKNQPDFRKEIDRIVVAINALTLAMDKKERESQIRHMEQMKRMEEKGKDKEYNMEDKKSDDIDLEDFRVADSAEPVLGYQYFGFVNDKGEWYIMYNEAAEGKVRYKFGKDNYERNWELYGNHEYMLFNEAIKEVMPSEDESDDTVQD